MAAWAPARPRSGPGRGCARIIRGLLGQALADVRRCPAREATPGSGLCQAVALAVHAQDMNMMREPVEQRAGQTLRAEDRSPFLERQVRCDDGRAVLVALERSSFMMIRSLAVTSNAGPGCLLQVPVPYLSMPDTERLILTVANLIPKGLA